MEMQTSNVQCSEVIEDFARYLLGAGFLHCNIIEGFQEYIDEYAPALIDAGDRLNTMVGKGE